MASSACTLGGHISPRISPLSSFALPNNTSLEGLGHEAEALLFTFILMRNLFLGYLVFSHLHARGLEVFEGLAPLEPPTVPFPPRLPFRNRNSVGFGAITGNLFFSQRNICKKQKLACVTTSFSHCSYHVPHSLVKPCVQRTQIKWSQSELHSVCNQNSQRKDIWSRTIFRAAQ